MHALYKQKQNEMLRNTVIEQVTQITNYAQLLLCEITE